MENKSLEVLIIGGGMITHDLLLPSVYHLQRTGAIGRIQISALNNAPLRFLMESRDITDGFPGQTFTPHPALSEAPEKNFPDLYKQALASMPPRQIVIVAMPDQMHYAVVMEALKNNQHVLCVKVGAQYSQAVEIEELALSKGLFVGVEYHKRFDRSALARRLSIVSAILVNSPVEAKLVEPYYYRNSVFRIGSHPIKQIRLFVGCHYVDLVYFITNLRPIEVSVAGVGALSNGKEGYMWANGRVRFENQALLTVTDGLGYPDAGAGSNEQCLTMFCEGQGNCGLIQHDDQFRGVIHSYINSIGSSGAQYKYVNPDFYRLVPWDGPGAKPVGYGYESVAGIIGTILRIESETAALAESDALIRRRELIRAVDEQGLIATPANSYINELVVEAARMSITQDGLPVQITYDGTPSVHPRRF